MDWSSPCLGSGIGRNSYSQNPTWKTNYRNEAQYWSDSGAHIETDIPKLYSERLGSSVVSQNLSFNRSEAQRTRHENSLKKQKTPNLWWNTFDSQKPHGTSAELGRNKNRAKRILLLPSQDRETSVLSRDSEARPGLDPFPPFTGSIRTPCLHWAPDENCLRWVRIAESLPRWPLALPNKYRRKNRETLNPLRFPDNDTYKPQHSKETCSASRNSLNTVSW